MEICENKKCTACYACVAICPHKCISMQEDKYGELHPVVDTNFCKSCGLCERVCPNNINLEFQHPQKCYASWITDTQKRANCASGGIGTLLAEYVISKSGVVLGTAYDKNFIPRATFAEDFETLERFKGSKYAQSIVGNTTFAQVKSFLNNGRLVLYIGTPCQIAGLKCYLRKDYPNLITVDLICHGVCPTKWFGEEVSYISSKHRINDLVDVRFRGNDGNNYCLTFWQGKSILECSYIRPRYEQPYFAGFILGVSLRENCYTCNYARPERVGDITIGDFLCLGKTVPFPYQVKQPSVVLINNVKSIIFYGEFTKEMGDKIVNVEREYSERLAYKPSLLEPFKCHPLKYQFRKNVLKYGFVKAIRKTLRFTILRYKIKRYKNVSKCVLKKYIWQL